MVRVAWNSEELKKEIDQYPDSEWFYGYSDLHVFIRDLDIVKGSYTSITNFFGFCFYALSTLDSRYFKNKTFHYKNDRKGLNCVSGEGFTFCLMQEESTDSLKIKYQAMDTLHFQTIETSSKEFIRGILKSYRRLYRELVDFQPGIKNKDPLWRLQEDAKCIEDWYNYRYPINSDTEN